MNRGGHGMVIDSRLPITAVGLGIAYASAPGAVNTEALRRGLERGFRPALLVQTGALIGDLLWAALALTGVSLLFGYRPVQIVLGIAGGCFLLRLAWSALQAAWQGGLPGAQGNTTRGDFATGAFFSLANPLGIAFWAGIGGGFTVGMGARSSLIPLLAGFAVGAFLWCLGFALAVSWGRRFVRPVVFRVINALCGLALGYFGGRLLWNTAQTLLERPVASASAWLHSTMNDRLLAANPRTESS